MPRFSSPLETVMRFAQMLEPNPEHTRRRLANMGTAGLDVLYSPLAIRAMLDTIPATLRGAAQQAPPPQQPPMREGNELGAVLDVARALARPLQDFSRAYDQRVQGLESHYPAAIQNAISGMRARAAEDPEGAAMLAIMQLFHGSPHRFTKFKHVDDVARTGQGANSYGHGIYLAENPAVAKSYAAELGGKPEVMLNGSPLRNLSGQLDDDEYWAAQSLLSRGDIAAVEKISPEINPKVAAGLSKLKRRGELSLAGGGTRYNVLGDFDPEDLLDWDKPIREQSPAVLERLKRGKFVADDDMDTLAGDWISASTHYRNGDWGKSDLSRALSEAGIPGLRYLDGDSRVVGEGTRNVVWWGDPEKLRIDAINDEPIR